MSSRKREIETLRAQIAKLEQAEEKEAKEKQALENTQKQILDILESADLSLESFIRYNYKTARRVVAKIEKEQSLTNKKDNTGSKRKAAPKKRKRTSKAKLTIKIPAGNYSNIPSEPDKVYEVKEKGPRPKALKMYAEEIGLEKFLEQCRVN